MRLQTLNIAHQGASGYAPSNTFAAFNRAVELGADIIEIDVVTTKDGVVVVSHDTTVDRRTTGTGRIDHMTLAEIKELDAGTPFDPRFSNERIPTLLETLDWAKKQPIRLCIEIKGDTTDEYLGNTRAVVPVLQQNNYLQNATITSFSPDCVRLVKDTEPCLSVALDPDKQDGSCTPWELIRQTLSCGANFLLHNHRALTSEIVNEAHQHGICLWAWSPNEADDMRRAAATGADGIMTNYPDILSNVLREFTEWCK